MVIPEPAAMWGIDPEPEMLNGDSWTSVRKCGVVILNLKTALRGELR
jgi:hypothetical protein